MYHNKIVQYATYIAEMYVENVITDNSQLSKIQMKNNNNNPKLHNSTLHSVKFYQEATIVACVSTILYNFILIFYMCHANSDMVSSIGTMGIITVQTLIVIIVLVAWLSLTDEMECNTNWFDNC